MKFLRKVLALSINNTPSRYCKSWAPQLRTQWNNFIEMKFIGEHLSLILYRMTEVLSFLHNDLLMLWIPKFLTHDEYTVFKTLIVLFASAHAFLLLRVPLNKKDHKMSLWQNLNIIIQTNMFIFQLWNQVLDIMKGTQIYIVTSRAEHITQTRNSFHFLWHILKALAYLRPLMRI